MISTIGKRIDLSNDHRIIQKEKKHIIKINVNIDVDPNHNMIWSWIVCMKTRKDSFTAFQIDLHTKPFRRWSRISEYMLKKLKIRVITLLSEIFDVYYLKIISTHQDERFLRKRRITNNEITMTILITCTSRKRFILDWWECPAVF